MKDDWMLYLQFAVVLLQSNVRQAIIDVQPGWCVLYDYIVVSSILSIYVRLLPTFYPLISTLQL